MVYFLDRKQKEEKYSMKLTKREAKRYERILGEKKVYDMTPEELERPITKQMGELCRHRLEKRWYRRLVFLNFALIIAVIACLVIHFGEYIDLGKQYAKQVVKEMDEETGKRTKEEKKETQKEEKLTQDDIPVAVQAFAFGILLLVIGYLGLYYYNAYYRSMSLRITEKNFPEVYATIEEYAKRLGIAVPKAYVMQSSGILNAFSTFLFKRQWICIHAELFEVAYREHHDMDALNFVIAHEMAHIYYGHATLHYNLPIWFSDKIPVIGAIASRTREYSCDRLAQRLTGVSGIESMLMLVVDRHLYKLVDQEDYINEMRSQKGFFIWYVNLLADHPVMCKRVDALAQGRGSGALY